MRHNTAQIGYGIIRVISKILSGFIPMYLIQYLYGWGLLPPSYYYILELAITLANISILLVMRYWSTLYLVDWIIGTAVLHHF